MSEVTAYPANKLSLCGPFGPSLLCVRPFVGSFGLNSLFIVIGINSTEGDLDVGKIRKG